MSKMTIKHRSYDVVIDDPDIQVTFKENQREVGTIGLNAEKVRWSPRGAKKWREVRLNEFIDWVNQEGKMA